MAWKWMVDDDKQVFDVPIQSCALSSVAESLRASSCCKAAVQRSNISLSDINARISLSRPLTSEGGALTLCVAFGLVDEEPQRQLSLDIPQHNEGCIQVLVEEAVGVLGGDQPEAAPAPSVEQSLTSPEPIVQPVEASDAVGCAVWPLGDFVSSCNRGQLLMLQPRVSQQRHQNACGYHAWHNAQLLLKAADALAQGSVPSLEVHKALQDERCSWRRLLASLHVLQTKPPEGSKWKPAVVRSCTLDQCHIRHLLSLERALIKRIFIVEAETGGLGEAKDAVVDLVKGKGESVAFILGCVTHWVAVAVASAPSGPVLLLADSFNKCLLNNIPPAELAEKVVDGSFQSFVEKITAEMPRYIEAPESVLRELFETGVPEWWQGKEKHPFYWKHRAASAKRGLQEMEIKALYTYLDELEKLLIDKSNL